MPDLTTEYATACETQRSWETTVLSSDGKTKHTVRWERFYGYLAEKMGCQYGYTCTCKGFEWRSDCKHARAAYAADRKDEGQRDRCGWDDRWDAARSADDSCPHCGGETFTYAFGA